MPEQKVIKPEPEKAVAPVVAPNVAAAEAPKPAEWEQREESPEEKKAAQVKKVEALWEKMAKTSTELEEKRKAEQEKKEFLKKEYNYESTSGNPPDINPEDAAVEEHYLWDIKKEREKLEKDGVTLLTEKHQEETKLIDEHKTLEWLDPEAKKAAEKAIQTEYLRKSLSSIPLDNPVIKWLEEEAKKINSEYDTMTPEEKYQLLARTPSAQAKIAAYLEEYNAVESGKMTDAKIQELTKKHFWIESLIGEEISAFELPKSEDTLKDETLAVAAQRGLGEHNFQELVELRWDSLEWKDIPDSIKIRIQFDPYFTMDETKLPVKFREELQEMKAIAREEQRPDETPEQYVDRIQETTGATPQVAAEVQRQMAWGRNTMSPFFRALADLLAPLFASFLTGEARVAWQNYMRNNSIYTSWTLAEREARSNYGGGGGVGGGGEVQWSMPGYSLDVNGEITETEKQAITTIHGAFKTKVTDVAMQAKLLTILERHAKNNPNFTASQPFLAHDVGTKQAFVFFPPGEAVVCWATHGYGGVWNVSGAGGTSLGSKTLSKWWEWNGMNSRTIVHGLEDCNKNDEQRLIRVHESRWAGTKTAGCTGLDPEIAERLQQAVISAGGGAQETFNSNSVPSGAPESTQTGENPGQLNAATEKAKETKEQMTETISYAAAKKLIESGAQPEDPPKIYKIDMSTYSISDRYRGNTDPSAGEDAANRNLTAKWKEYIAVHGTASSDISGFHMMLESGLFPYLVTTKWLVFQGADDMTTGSCVSSDKADPNMAQYGLDNFNNRWIAIEVSQATVGIWGTELTPAQKNATRELVNVLRWAHDIGAGNVITSADPVRDLNTGNLVSGAHGDDFDDSDRREMGIALSGEVRNRLKTGSFFSDEMATNQRLREAQESSWREQMSWSSDSSVDSLISQIKQNESWDTRGNEWYAWWNNGENFPSMWFAHFTWGTGGNHGNSFYNMMNFITQSRWIQVPPELNFLRDANPPNNWNGLSSMQRDPKYRAVTEFLSRSDVKRAGYDFIKNGRLDSLKTRLAGDALNKFNLIAQWPKGAYILIDYVNFKGEWEGRGGWWLKNVLDAMPAARDPLDAARKFRDTAERLLWARSDSWRWMAGWSNRLDTYV